MTTRTILISLGAAILVAMASLANADHRGLAVAVHYGPAYVRYVEPGHYYDSYHRYVPVRAYRDDYRKGYRKARHYKKHKHARRYRKHYSNDWCRIERRHWH